MRHGLKNFAEFFEYFWLRTVRDLKPSEKFLTITSTQVFTQLKLSFHSLIVVIRNIN